MRSTRKIAPWCKWHAAPVVSLLIYLICDVNCFGFAFFSIFLLFWVCWRVLKKEKKRAKQSKDGKKSKTISNRNETILRRICQRNAINCHSRHRLCAPRTVHAHAFCITHFPHRSQRAHENISLISINYNSSTQPSTLAKHSPNRPGNYVIALRCVVIAYSFFLSPSFSFFLFLFA